jgi:hypothetical protein
MRYLSITLMIVVVTKPTSVGGSLSNSLMTTKRCYLRREGIYCMRVYISSLQHQYLTHVGLLPIHFK